MEFSKSYQRAIVNRYATFNMLLDEDGQDIREENVNCLCPFHDNQNTPSAKIYNDESGQTLYCYAEQRLYRPADLCVLGKVSKSLTQVFSKIYVTLSDVEKNVSDEYEKKISKNNIKEVDNTEFRKGNISCQDMLRIIRNKLDEEPVVEDTETYTGGDDAFSNIENIKIEEPVEIEDGLNWGD